MKRYLSIIIIALLPLQLFAQKPAINYSIIKMAIKQIDTGKIFISNRLNGPSLSEEKITFYEKELSGKIPLKNLKEIIKNVYEIPYPYKDTMLQDSLEDFQYVNRNRLEALLIYNGSGGYPILIRGVSIPVFDNAKTYFVIEYSKMITRSIKVGCFYLFKKVKGKWIQLCSFDNWIT